eukprot:Em0027g20a
MSEVPGEHQAENPASSDPSVENLHQLIQSVVRRAMEAERSRLSAAPGSAQTSSHLGSGWCGMSGICGRSFIESKELAIFAQQLISMITPPSRNPGSAADVVISGHPSVWAIAEFTLRFCARLDFGSLPSNAMLSLANIPIVSDAAGGNAPLEADIPQRPSTQQPLPQNSADTAQGVSIGDGLLTVPKKLAERIWRWEFVELGDLLPENWVGKTEDTNPLGVVRRKRQITDIHTWIQCFASFVSVQSLKYPEAVPVS